MKSEIPARAGGWQLNKKVAHYCCKVLLDVVSLIPKRQNRILKTRGCMMLTFVM